MHIFVDVVLASSGGQDIPTAEDPPDSNHSDDIPGRVVEPMEDDHEDGNGTSDVFQFSDNNSSSEEEPFPKRRKVAKKSNRVQWTELEMQEIKKYLGGFLASKITPGKKDCILAISKSKSDGGQLHRRDYTLIVKKVSNMNRK